MSQPSLDQFRKRAVLLKQEVTEGVDSSPVGATNAVLLMDGQSSTEVDVVEREIDRPFFTNNAFGTTNRRAIIEGSFELFPPVTPGAALTSDAACSPLLLPAGMAVVKNLGAKTTRYNPASSAIPSSTAYWHQNDILIRALGCRHNISGLSIQIGNRFSGQVRVQGSYESVEASSLPTAILYTDVPPFATYRNTVAHVTNPVGGTNLLVWAKSLQIDFGNELGTKEYSSVKLNQVSDRRATFTMRIARTALADFNPWTVRDAGTVIGLKMRTYNVEHPTAPVGLYSELGVRGQIEGVQIVDIDGDTGFELTGRCIAGNSGGDDFYIEFGDTTP